MFQKYFAFILLLLLSFVGIAAYTQTYNATLEDNESIFLNASDIAVGVTVAGEHSLEGNHSLLHSQPRIIYVYNDSTQTTGTTVDVTTNTVSFNTTCEDCTAYQANITAKTTSTITIHNVTWQPITVQTESNNTAPTHSTPILNSTNGGPPLVEDNLTVTPVNATDAENNTISFAYDWRINNASITSLNTPFNVNETNASSSPNDYTSYNSTIILGGGNQTRTPEWNSSCVLAGCYVFDGINDVIEIPRRSELEPASFTISVWIKPGSWNDIEFERIIDKGSYAGADYQGYSIIGSQTGGEIRGRFGDNNGSYYDTLSGVEPTPGQWHHIVYTVESGSQILYINGTAQGTTNHTQDVQYGTQNLSLGSLSGQNQQTYNGSIDQLSIYNRALTPTQVNTIYNGGTPREDLLRNTETASQENWSVAVTPIDQYGAGITKYTAELQIEEPRQVPNTTGFDGNTTDFYEVSNLSAVPNVTLQKTGLSKITWSQFLDVTNISDFQPIVGLGKTYVYVNSTTHPELDAPATVTWENTSVKNPVVYRDGSYCSACNITSTSPLTVEVPGFSNYTVENNTAPTITATLQASTPSNHTEDTIEVTINASDADNQTLYNSTDWRKHNESIALLNLPFNDNTTDDITTYNRNVTSPSPPAWKTNCTNSPCYEFNETTHLEIQDFPDIQTSFTVSAWINTENVSTENQRVVADDDNSASENGWAVSVSDGGNTGALRFLSRQKDTVSLDANNTIQSDTWHHITAVYDAETLTRTLYVDGVQEAQLTNDTGTWGVDSGPTTIGGVTTTADTPGNQFHGYIDDVKIFNDSLGADEVANLYRNGSGTHLSLSNTTTSVRDTWNTYVETTDTLNTTNTTTNTLYIQPKTPTLTNHAVSSSESYNTSAENITVTYTATDPDNLAVYNSTDWRESNTSIAVLHAPFNQKPSKNASKDLTTYNHTVHLGNGTESTQPAWSENCQEGGCYTFDGTNDYLKTQNFTATTDELTISAWVRLENTTSGNSNIQPVTVKQHHTELSNNRTWWLVHRDEKWEFSLSADGTPLRINSTNTSQTKTWVHLGVIANGSTAKLYVDGVKQPGSISYTSIDDQNSSTYIGAEVPQSRYFNGSIDEVRVFDRALTPGQLTELRNGNTEQLLSQETQIGETWSAQTTTTNTYESTTSTTPGITIQNTVTYQSGTTPPGNYTYSDTNTITINASNPVSTLTNLTATITTPTGTTTNTTNTSPLTWTYNATQPGNYTFNVEATHEDGTTYNTPNRTVTLENTAPTTTASILTTENQNTSLEHITLNVSVSDPDNQTLTPSTDWQRDGNSITVLHMPFHRNITSTATGSLKGISTFRNNGTLGGGDVSQAPKWTSWKNGSYRFDGTNDRIELPVTSSTNITDNFTVAAWINSSNIDKYQHIFSKGTSSGDDIETAIFQSRMYSRINIGGTTYNQQGSTVLQNNTYYHLAWRYNGSHVTYFLDGTVEHSFPATGSVNNQGTTIYIGEENGFGANFQGHITEVKVYDEALPSQQIEYLAEGMQKIHARSTTNGDTWSVTLHTAEEYDATYTADSNTINLITPLQYNPSTTQSGLYLFENTTPQINTTTTLTNATTTHTYNAAIDTETSNATTQTYASELQSKNKTTYNLTATINAYNDTYTLPSRSVTLQNTEPNTSITLNTTQNQNTSLENITATVITNDADNDTITSATDWQRNGASITRVNLPFLSQTQTKSRDTYNLPVEVGLGNTATTPTWTAEKNGAYVFDGDQDTIRINDTANLTVDEVSLEAWVKIVNTSTDPQLIIGNGGGWDAEGYHLMMYNGGIRFEVQSSNKTILDTSAIANNTWHHVVGTYDGGTAAVYLDGALQESQPLDVPTINPAYNLHLGTDPGYMGSHTPLEGTIAHTRIYDRGLTADQVELLYETNGTAPLSAIDASEILPGENWSATLHTAENQLTVYNITSNTVRVEPPLAYQGTTQNGTYTYHNSTVTANTTTPLTAYDDITYVLAGPTTTSYTTTTNPATYTFTPSNYTQGNYTLTATITGNNDTYTLPSRTYVFTNTEPTTTTTLSTSDTKNTTVENLTLTAATNDIDNDTITLVADWRANTTSLAVVNLPFNVDSTIARDFTTYQNNGTLGAGDPSREPTFSRDCPSGGCYVFDNTDDIIEVYGSNLNILGDLTMVAWIKPLSTGSGCCGAQILIKDDGANMPYSFQLSPQRNIRVQTRPGVQRITSADKVTLGQWTHVAAVRDASREQLTFYINGVQDSGGWQNYTADFSTTSAPLEIGNRGSTSTNPFNGSIDEVLVADKVFSGEQIQRIINEQQNNVTEFKLLPGTTQKNTSYTAAITPSDNYTYGATNTTPSLPIVQSVAYRPGTTTTGNYTYENNRNITVSVEDNVSTLTQLNISIYNDEGTLLYSNTSPTSPFTWVKNITQGTYLFNATSTHSNGATDSTPTRTITYENTPPTIDALTINTSSLLNTTVENVSVFIRGDDTDDDIVSYTIDWRENAQSIAGIHMPFNTEVTDISQPVLDYSTYQRNGTLGDGTQSQAPSWTTDCITGGCYSFDGDDIISVTTAYNPVTNFTFTLWDNPASSVWQKDLLSTEKYALQARGGDYRIFFRDQDLNYIPLGFGNPQTGQWTHLAVTVEAVNSTHSTFKGYQDGVLVLNSTQRNAMDTQTPGITIGDERNGTLDEVTIYNTPLSQKQIQHLLHQQNETQTTVSTATLYPGVTRKNTTYTVKVTPTDGYDVGTPQISSALLIQNAIAYNPNTFTSGNYTYASTPYIDINVTDIVPTLTNITINIYNRTGGLHATNTSNTSPFNWRHTGITHDTYTFNATSTHSNGATDTTPSRTVTFENTEPAIQNLVINTTEGQNTTAENITTYITANDPDNDTLRYVTDWRENGTSVSVLNLPMDENTSSPKDFSTFMNNASIGNGTEQPSWTTNCVLGGCFRFDGYGDLIIIPDDTSLEPQNLTVSTWVRLDQLETPTTGGASSNQSQTILFKKNSRTSYFEGYRLIKNTGNTFSFTLSSSDGTQNSVSTTTTILPDTWYHVVATFERPTMRIYVNGVQEGTATHNYSLDYGSSPLVLGRTGEGFDSHLIGTLDEVRIQDRALTQKQIAVLAQNTSSNESTLSATETAVDTYSAAITPFDGEVYGNTTTTSNLTTGQWYTYENTTLPEGTYFHANQSTIPINVSTPVTFTNITVDVTGTQNLTNASTTSPYYWDISVPRGSYNVTATLHRNGNAFTTPPRSYTLVNTAPAPNTSITSTTGRNGTRDNLTANTTLSDADNDTMYYVDDWRVNGVSDALLYHPFNQNLSNVSTGAITGSTTRQHNLTLGDGNNASAPTWSESCQQGGCYTFDGVDDLITRPTYPDTLNDGFTISYWMYSNDEQGHMISSAQCSDCGNSRNLRMYWVSGGVDAYIGGNNLGPTFSGATDRWQHIALTWNPETTEGSIYMDGQEIYSETGVGAPNVDSNELVLGYNGFNGSLDELRIYDYAFTPQNINETYQAQQARLTNETVQTTLPSIRTQPRDNITYEVTVYDAENQTTNTKNFEVQGVTFTNETTPDFIYLDKQNLTLQTERSTEKPGNTTIHIWRAGTEILNFTSANVTTTWTPQNISYSLDPLIVNATFTTDTHTYRSPTYRNYTLRQNQPPENLTVTLTSNETWNTSDNQYTTTVTSEDNENDTTYYAYDWRINNESTYILHYTFNENTNGTTLPDYTSYNHTAELGAGQTNRVPTWTREGILGGAYDFDGSNDVIRVPPRDTLRFTEDWTVGMWIYPESNTGNPFFFQQPSPTYSNNIGLAIYGSNFRSYHENGNLNNANSITLNTWQFITVTYDASTSTYTKYIDGTQRTSYSEPFVPHANPIHIGADSDSAGAYDQHFDGRIDEVFLIDTALTQTEIAQLRSQYLNNTASYNATWLPAQSGDEVQSTVTAADTFAVGATAQSNPVTITGAYYNNTVAEYVVAPDTFNTIIETGGPTANITATLYRNNTLQDTQSTTATTLNVTWNASQTGIYTVNATATFNGTSYQTNIVTVKALEEVPGQTYTLYTEDFEQGFTNFTNTGGDTFQWTSNMGSTPTQSTGPSTAGQGTTYAYTETDSTTAGDDATLISPTINFNTYQNITLKFDRHRYSFAEADSTLLIQTDDGNTVRDITEYAKADEGNQWLPSTVRIYPEAEGITGTGNILITGVVEDTRNPDRADQAVDNITLLGDIRDEPLVDTYTYASNTSTGDLGAITGYYFGNTQGRIVWLNPVNVTATNFDEWSNIAHEEITVNFGERKFGAPHSSINSSANLTFYNITPSYENHQVYRDGTHCPDNICTVLTPFTDNVTINVTQFSTYSVENNTAPDITDYATGPETVLYGEQPQPVAEYLFEGNADDTSSNNHDGTVSGPSLGLGSYGEGYTFDGTGSITITNDPQLQLNGDVSICMWVRPSNLGNRRENIVDKAVNGEFALTVEPSGQLSSYFGNSSSYANGNDWSNVFTEDRWVHICWVRDVTQQSTRLYQNAVDRGSQSNWNGIGTTSDDILIGDGYTNPFTGNIDEVRIYDEVLTQREVTRIYKKDSYTTDNLTYTGRSDDIDNDTTAITYDWRRNGQSIAVLNTPFVERNVSMPRDYSTNKYVVQLGGGNQSRNPTWNDTNCVTRGCYEFDGVDDGMNLTGDIVPAGTKTLTLEAWAYLRSDSSSGRKIICQDDCGEGGPQYALQVYPDRAQMRIFNGTTRNADGAEVPLNTWTHIVGTYDGEQIKIYQDGNLTGNLTYSAGIEIGPGNLLIGNGRDQGGGPGTNAPRNWDGFLDDIKIYERALSAPQIQQRYEEGLYSLNNNAQPNTTLVAEETVKHEEWSIISTPTDSYTDGNSTSRNITILNTPPTHTKPTLQTLSGENTTIDTLQAVSNDVDDNNSDALTTQYDWRRNGESLAVLNYYFDVNASQYLNVTDHSQSNLDGELGRGNTTRSPTWTLAGYPSRAFDFDGVNDVIAIEDSPLLTDEIAEKSVSAWIRPDSTTGTRMIYEEGGALNGFNLYISNGRLYGGSYADSSNPSGDTYLSASINASEWTHVQWAYRAGHQATLYVNGDLVNTSASDFEHHSHGDNAGIGGINSDTKTHTQTLNELNAPFDGIIDQVKVYDVFIDERTAQSIYESDSSGGQELLWRNTVIGDNWTVAVTQSDRETLSAQRTTNGVALNSPGNVSLNDQTSRGRLLPGQEETFSTDLACDGRCDNITSTLGVLTQLGEAKTIQANNTWKTITFNETYPTPPHIFLAMNSDNGENGLIPQLRNADTTSAEVRVCKSNPGSGCTTTANHNVAVLVISEDVENYTEIETGTVNLTGNIDTNTVSPAYTAPFTKSPLVFSQIQNSSNTNIQSRILGRTTTGTTLGLCEQTTTDGCGSASQHRVSWLAIPRDAEFYPHSHVAHRSLNGNTQRVDFQTPFNQQPAVLTAPIGGYDEQQDLTVQLANLDENGYQFSLCETQSLNTCDSHTYEPVNALAVRQGPIKLFKELSVGTTIQNNNTQRTSNTTSCLENTTNTTCQLTWNVTASDERGAIREISVQPRIKQGIRKTQNSTHTYTINTLPNIDQPSITTENNRPEPTQNLTGIPGNASDEQGDTVVETHDWRLNNDSIYKLHLPFNVDEYYNKTLGVTDVSSYNNTASLSNNTSLHPEWVPTGRIGGAYEFDGVDDTLGVANESHLNNLTTFSAGFWMNTSSLNSVDQSFLMYKSTYEEDGFAIFDDGQFTSIVACRVNTAGAHTDVSVPRSTVNDGAWHHITCTYNGSSLRLYVDGVLEDSVATTQYTPNTERLFIGEFGGEQGSGTLDEVFLTDRVLTADQIQDIYAYGSLGYTSYNSTIHSSETQQNDSWTVAVTPSDSYEYGAANTSEPILISSDAARCAVTSCAPNYFCTDSLYEGAQQPIVCCQANHCYEDSTLNCYAPGETYQNNTCRNGVWINNEGRFDIRDTDNNTVASFDMFGSLAVNGTITQTCTPTNTGWTVPSTTPTTQITAAGDMCVAGIITERNITSPCTTTNCVEIQNASGAAKARIYSTGNISIAGDFTGQAGLQ